MVILSTTEKKNPPLSHALTDIPGTFTLLAHTAGPVSANGVLTDHHQDQECVFTNVGKRWG